MTIAAWIIAGVCAALLGAVLWDRARRAAMLGASIAERDSARTERDRLRAELDAAIAQREAALHQVRSALVEAAELRAQVQQASERERLARESFERREADRAAAHARALADRDAAAQTQREQAARAQQQAQDEFERRLTAVQAQIKGFMEEAAKRALDSSQQSFMKLAAEHFETRAAAATGELEARRAAVEGLVKPLGEAVEKTRELLSKSDEQRAAELSRLLTEVQHTQRLNAEVKQETAKLARAMSRPEVRGRYGELQLQRVLELAGMREHIDFGRQQSSRDGEGALQRPDVIVSLPNERRIVIDAKANLEAFVRAAGADDEQERERCLDKFADDVNSEMKRLSSRRYSESIGEFDFVVMFIPGDQLIDAALQRRPDLLDESARQNVVIASPSTLIGLLRAVSAGWRERRVAENAREMLKLGRDLHERAGKVLEHAGALGDVIARSVDRYNALVGSIDSRLMPKLREFEVLGADGGEPAPSLDVLQATVRPLASLPVPEKQ